MTGFAFHRRTLLAAMAATAVAAPARAGAPIRLGVLRTVSPAPFYIAHSRGLFAAQGVEVWPNPLGAAGTEDEGQDRLVRGLSCLTDELALPHPNALFDRVLMVHALEESDDPLGVMREVGRVMAPSGRVIIVAANRRGAWANSEATPFGHGRPFTRAQLEALVREAGLEPTAWSRALYLPPLAWLGPWAEAFEQAGARLWPGLSGLILLEAVKQTFAVKPRGHGARARVIVPGALQPMPAPSTGRDRVTQAL